MAGECCNEQLAVCGPTARFYSENDQTYETTISYVTAVHVSRNVAYSLRRF